MVVAIIAIMSNSLLAFDHLEYVETFSQQYEVPIEIVLAVIEQESSFNPLAVNYNRNGSMDIGLMQINTKSMPHFQQVFEQKGIYSLDATSPRDNIWMGVAYLAELYETFGNWYDAITAYNAGPTRTRNGRAPEVSLRYAERVLFRAYYIRNEPAE